MESDPSVSHKAVTLSDFEVLLQATNIAIPLPSEYQAKDCLGCLLEKICDLGKGENLSKQ